MKKAVTGTDIRSKLRDCIISVVVLKCSPYFSGIVVLHINKVGDRNNYIVSRNSKLFLGNQNEVVKILQGPRGTEGV